MVKGSGWWFICLLGEKYYWNPTQWLPQCFSVELEDEQNSSIMCHFVFWWWCLWTLSNTSLCNSRGVELGLRLRGSGVMAVYPSLEHCRVFVVAHLWGHRAQVNLSKSEAAGYIKLKTHELKKCSTLPTVIIVLFHVSMKNIHLLACTVCLYHDSSRKTTRPGDANEH